ncbi:hypothetical protein Pelo_19163 [Pelomyxa schiedti]|nr:hypothetical protein Pelo_19163 [Pelomyxa schiedti]
MAEFHILVVEINRNSTLKLREEAETALCPKNVGVLEGGKRQTLGGKLGYVSSNDIQKCNTRPGNSDSSTANQK